LDTITPLIRLSRFHLSFHTTIGYAHAVHWFRLRFAVPHPAATPRRVLTLGLLRLYHRFLRCGHHAHRFTAFCALPVHGSPCTALFCARLGLVARTAAHTISSLPHAFGSRTFCHSFTYLVRTRFTARSLPHGSFVCAHGCHSFHLYAFSTTAFLSFLTHVCLFSIFTLATRVCLWFSFYATFLAPRFTRSTAARTLDFVAPCIPRLPAHTLTPLRLPRHWTLRFWTPVTTAYA